MNPAVRTSARTVSVVGMPMVFEFSPGESNRRLPQLSTVVLAIYGRSVVTSARITTVRPRPVRVSERGTVPFCSGGLRKIGTVPDCF